MTDSPFDNPKDPFGSPTPVTPPKPLASSSFPPLPPRTLGNAKPAGKHVAPPLPPQRLGQPASTVPLPPKLSQPATAETAPVRPTPPAFPSQERPQNAFPQEPTRDAFTQLVTPEPVAVEETPIVVAKKSKTAKVPKAPKEPKRPKEEKEPKGNKKLVIIVASALVGLLLLAAAFFVFTGFFSDPVGKTVGEKDTSSSSGPLVPDATTTEPDATVPEAAAPEATVPDPSALANDTAENSDVFAASLNMMGVTTPLADAKILVAEACAIMADSPTTDRLISLSNKGDVNTDVAVITERGNIIGSGVSVYCPEYQDALIALIS